MPISKDVKNLKKGTVEIAGRTYPTIIFEYYGITYTYMTENLDLDVGEGCKYYNDDPKNAKKYGRLYTWDAIKNIVPELDSGIRRTRKSLHSFIEWRN